MYYEFPKVDDLQYYLSAIKGSEEFIVKRDTNSGIVVLDYIFVCPTTFPDPNTLEGNAALQAAMRRECRGLKFDIQTEKIIVRPYAKFFNVGEKPETQIGVIDWSQPHVVLDKLDGSLINLWRYNNKYECHTKKGATEVAGPVTKFVEQSSLGYIALYEAMREENKTCLFEWCSRKQKIVIDFPVDKLVLTAIRDNFTGEYMLYPKLVELGSRFNVPVVQAFASNFASNTDDIQAFLKDVAQLENTEGFIIRFDNGMMYKVKADWYVQIARTTECFHFEKSVWNLILSNTLDDAKPFMNDEHKAIIEDFAAELNVRMLAKAKALETYVQERRNIFGHDKKSFALEVTAQIDKRIRGVVFKIWDGHDSITVLRELLLKNVGTQKEVDSVRDLLDDLDWKDFYMPE